MCHHLYFLHPKSITRVFVTLLIFAQIPCIQFPHDFQNTEFAIVFLPQMLHGSFMLDGYILICPILLSITFVFTRFTFRPILSSALFQVSNYFCSFTMISAIRTKSSAYSNSCNVPSIYLVCNNTNHNGNNSGDKTDP